MQHKRTSFLANTQLFKEKFVEHRDVFYKVQAGDLQQSHSEFQLTYSKFNKV